MKQDIKLDMENKFQEENYGKKIEIYSARQRKKNCNRVLTIRYLMYFSCP